MMKKIIKNILCISLFSFLFISCTDEIRDRKYVDADNVEYLTVELDKSYEQYKIRISKYEYEGHKYIIHRIKRENDKIIGVSTIHDPECDCLD